MIFRKILILTVFVFGNVSSQSRQIRFYNKCSQDIWIATLTNNNGPSLREGIVRIGRGNSGSYSIPNSGWAGRFWPKLGCDGSGQNCKVGQSNPPCPPKGCSPPADTKVEFFFPSNGASNAIWYDVSLVDGYSLPVSITPNNNVGGTCKGADCRVTMDRCPQKENNVGDLRVKDPIGNTVMCLSPCKKWNFPAPYGMGRNEQQDPGLHYCCPTPPVSAGQCRQGPVIQTQYVKLIHSACPIAYSYAYDDEVGLHNCPSTTSYSVTFCP